MSHLCKTCASTESEAVANAKALGLLQELQTGVYTCCQIRQWTREQSLAWSEAAQQDGHSADSLTNRPELEEPEAVLVPVRLRRRNGFSGNQTSPSL